MARVLGVFLLYCVICLHMDTVSAAEKEVLVRDRLVFLLCDQMAQYMTDGKYPAEVKTMPDKYKKIRPGAGGNVEGVKGRSSAKGVKVNKGDVSKSKSSKSKGRSSKAKGSNRLKRQYEMTVLDLNDNQWW